MCMVFALVKKTEQEPHDEAESGAGLLLEPCRVLFARKIHQEIRLKIPTNKFLSYSGNVARYKHIVTLYLRSRRVLVEAGAVWVTAACYCVEQLVTLGSRVLSSMGLWVLKGLAGPRRVMPVIQQNTCRVIWLWCKHPSSLLKSEWNWGFIQPISRHLCDLGHALSGALGSPAKQAAKKCSAWEAELANTLLWLSMSRACAVERTVTSACELKLSKQRMCWATTRAAEWGSSFQDTTYS